MTVSANLRNSLQNFRKSCAQNNYEILATPNPPTNIVDFGGFDSSRLLM